MTPAAKWRPRAGFTLLEILIASLILSIALIAIQASVLGMQESLIRSGEASLAARLAEDKLAEIEAGGEKALRLVKGDFSPEHPQWRWRIQTADPDFAGLTLVTVDVMRPASMDPAFTLEKLVFEK